CKNVNQFHPQFIVYRDLRERGYLVKTGYKFGAHFRVYERGVKLKRGPKAPHEHTKFVVHAVPEEAAFSLPEMSRAVRLAHNIRAIFVWAVVDKESDVTYYEIKRLTP
ncbi:MAG: tRNA-intron lyase, partial [Candidatus Aenigmarchaeota archaeon]|nr:tRNA-intron lyase [Candidatus Aenigmarchaeota archaeon]